MATNSKDCFPKNVSPVHKKNSKVDLKKWLMASLIRSYEPLQAKLSL